MMDKPLSEVGKNLLTFVGSVFLFNKVGSLANSRELSRLMGLQNINPTLADRLMDEFKYHHDLGDVKLSYVLDQKFPTTLQTKDGNKAGVSIVGSKGGLVDDPAIRIHEMAHASFLKDKSWHTGPLYTVAPVIAQAVAAVLAVEGMPIAAALAALFGHIPVLTAEHLATEKAKTFLQQHLGKEEAARAEKILASAFRTYMMDAASSAISAGVAGMLNRRST